ncbi:succinyl-diaminopimelate desuccinylase [Candidatus Liberibacter sp.]|uniref:succinyl-diaminopimelate desuccinylase n=1 Tax=Candidatus Liberibacter sp. TaxID=34022 RepID=UPI0015F4E21C|nr:succinyl-diaminopimelate desuccinylase [Candidatus Liberibacter sp.]MBA5724553.1 succinyl-diaminopimelate desuccinylase [Candidatus Liberibacter sp.]
MISSDPLENLVQLIKCPSVTPQNGGALSVLTNILKPLGFTIEKQIAQQDGTADVENLYARFGKKSPHFMFAGHIDVVPPGNLEDWRHPPFSATIEEGKIYGRGAVDMKGNIACFIAATSRFIQKYSDFGSISLLITGDEEGPAINGTKKALLWTTEKGESWDSCIVGEPTCRHVLGDTIKIGRRGSLSGHIIIHGTQGHVAYPHLANNPIHGLIPLLNELTRVEFDAGNADFPPTHLEVTTIDVGNVATNVIPGHVKLCFNIRFNNLWTEEKLISEIRSRTNKGLQRICQNTNHKEPSYTLHFTSPSSPVFLTQNEILVSSLSESINKITGKAPESSTSGGTSDARFIKNYCPVIEFGLVGKTMHAINENTEITDLEALTCIYERFLKNWFTKNSDLKN